MTALRVIPGGRNKPALVTIPLAAHQELHIELIAARAERLMHATEGRNHLRAALRHLSTDHIAAAGTCILEAVRVLDAEANRAISMSADCPCGVNGAGHGRADDAVLAVPLERVA
jgi:hypothetical protein